MNSKNDVLKRIGQTGLLAVIRGPSKDVTIKIVEALIEGGVKGIEITYTTSEAETVVYELARKYGDDILLGMGTLTKPEQALTAKDAGAKFLVSPICEPELVKAMVLSDLVSIAGALTPTEIYQAHQLGVDVVKVFPGSLTGPSYIKAIHGPFPFIKIMPTGGVSKENIADWLTAGAFAVGVGSVLCPKHLVVEGKFEEITKRAEAFMAVVKSSRK